MELWLKVLCGDPPGRVMDMSTKREFDRRKWDLRWS